MINYQTREQWLEAAMSELSPRFAALGHPLPDKIRVTCGFTSGGTRKRNGKAQIGECWDASRSGDQAFEIMVSPVEDDPVKVLAILTHELCHAAAGLTCGHRGTFAKLARGMKLEGALNATFGGIDFANIGGTVLRAIGDYPHAKLDTFKRPKQGIRMQLCRCDTCGYSVRTTAKWLSYGAPHCPNHGAMTIV